MSSFSSFFLLESAMNISDSNAFPSNGNMFSSILQSLYGISNGAGGSSSSSSSKTGRIRTIHPYNEYDPFNSNRNRFPIKTNFEECCCPNKPGNSAKAKKAKEKACGGQGNCTAAEKCCKGESKNCGASDWMMKSTITESEKSNTQVPCDDCEKCCTQESPS